MESEKPALFAICETCGGKFAHDDGHRQCMYCLYKRGHDVGRCKVCQTMKPRRRRDRETKVRARMAEEEARGGPPRRTPERSLEAAMHHKAPRDDRPWGPREPRDTETPRGRSPAAMPPPRGPSTLTSTTSPPSKVPADPTSRPPSRGRGSSTTRSTSSTGRRSSSRESVCSTSTSTSRQSTSKKRKEHGAHRPRKRPREDGGLPAEESEAEPFNFPDPADGVPVSILQDVDELGDVGPVGAPAHQPGPGSPLHDQVTALSKMQDSLQSLRAMMQRRDRDWQRQQQELVARLRQEEEDRRMAREAKEARDDARRNKELEALIRSLRAEVPRSPAPTPTVTPTPAPVTLPTPAPHRPRQEEEEDREPEGSDYEDEGAGDPLDMEPQQPRGEPLDPLEVPVPDPSLPTSPPDDMAQFCTMIHRAASHFGIPTQKEVSNSSILMDKMSPPMKNTTQLPTDSYILKRVGDVFSKPASAPAASSRAEKKYRVPDTDPFFLRGIPPPDSIVATAARKRSSSSSLASQSGPPEKEHRKLDTVGKKVCAAASLTIKEANYMALVSRYTRELWDSMEGFLRFVPEEQRQEAFNTISDGRICANHGVKMALDVADAAAHSMVHGVALRRHGWLQGSGFKPDIQHRLLDMPFDGQQLFGKEVEDSITKTKGELEAMKGVPGLQQQQPQAQRKKDFRSQGRKNPQQKKSDKPWTPTSRGGYGGSRGNGKRGRGGSNSRAPPKDKA